MRSTGRSPASPAPGRPRHLRRIGACYDPRRVVGGAQVKLAEFCTQRGKPGRRWGKFDELGIAEDCGNAFAPCLRGDNLPVAECQRIGHHHHGIHRRRLDPADCDREVGQIARNQRHEGDVQALRSLEADPADLFRLVTRRDASYTNNACEHALRPSVNSQAMLETKALQRAGVDGIAAPPESIGAMTWHLSEERADLFLCYSAVASQAIRHLPGTTMVAVPEALAVGADYGLALLSTKPHAIR